MEIWGAYLISRINSCKPDAKKKKTPISRTRPMGGTKGVMSRWEKKAKIPT
jgi:hypothetical protein